LELEGRNWREAGEDCIMNSITFYTSPNIVRVIKVEDEVGGARGELGRDETCVQDFG